MKSIRLLVTATLCAAITSTVAFSKGSSHSGGSSVHVRGYSKKDGTYVQPHRRSAPNSTKNDNWSTKGNVNPDNGKNGTKPADGEAKKN